MPKLEYFLVAESTSTDSDTNAISIFNVFTERRVESFPETVRRAILVTCWFSTEEELVAKPAMQAEIFLRVPDKELGPFRHNFTCESEFQHLLLEMEDLEISKPGLLEIELKVNGKHEATHRIRFSAQT